MLKMEETIEKTIITVSKDFEGFHLRIVYPAIPHTTRQTEQVYVHTFSRSEMKWLKKAIEKALKI